MPSTLQLEMDAHRVRLRTDLRDLVEKYRAIFEWDVPDIDEAASDRMILAALREALDDTERALRAGPRP